ncbi:type II toxin-antitoxin system PemK/MazF family toxin [Corynebacterium kalidii]|uniref:Type II toxin-antitoxin system PemK/MazF family toxin n=1 Tax=Corynebacterium kalidii TaxID=2931982 RepID=A0A9X1WKN1_9CORY|nr:type II toxin-antitoxin system PemK/MazF family toxin [Corynebacterium kalidii]MCJ7859090.1 type II toxin-antitoxin system PemK/MazF family toxin [Corynebacterium kalidii]
MAILRGTVYSVDLGIPDGNGGVLPPKPWLIVSTNRRNRSLGTYLGVRITTTSKFSHLPTVVALPPGEIANGWALCDDLDVLYDEDFTGHTWGALSNTAMRAVERGLQAALGMNDSGR